EIGRQVSSGRSASPAADMNLPMMSAIAFAPIRFDTKKAQNSQKLLRLLCLFLVSFSSLPRLRDRINYDWFAALNDFDTPFEGRSHIFRITDRADARQAVRLGHFGVVDVGFDQSRADVRMVHAAIPLRGHPLYKHHFRMVAPVVMH